LLTKYCDYPVAFCTLRKIPMLRKGSINGTLQRGKLTALLWYVLPIIWQNRGRNLAAVLAIAAGIGLATAIHTINQTAVGEFQSALARVNGAAQLQVRGTLAYFDETLLDTVLALTDVMEASPVIEITTTPANQPIAQDRATDTFKVIGIDWLRAPRVTPDLMPQFNRANANGTASLLFSDNTVFLGQRGAKDITPATQLVLNTAVAPKRYAIAGSVSLNDERRLVMDIATVQQDFALIGKLSRIDLLLKPGISIKNFQAKLQSLLGESIRVVEPTDEAQRMSNLSRAYRVNLTVLALVALVTGALIVFSTQGSMVLKQWSQLALMSLLGATRRWILSVVLAQGLILGFFGTVLGIALGWALAALLLQTVGTDLGGGYFSGQTSLPHLSFLEIVVLTLTGLLTGLMASWLPARAALATRSADALKPGHAEHVMSRNARRWPAVTLGLLGLALSFMPAIAQLPLAGYAAIACWLFAGVAAVPWMVTGLLAKVARRFSPYSWKHPALWLALQRIGQSPGLAIQAIAGVVASMALVTAMAIMVTSFRGSVANWLDQVLPADLYARFRTGTVSGFTPEDQLRIASLPFVERAEFLKAFELNLRNDMLPVAVLARQIDPLAPGKTLPINGAVQMLSGADQAAGLLPMYVSEAMVSLYNMNLGSVHSLRLPEVQNPVNFKVVAVWRDYARQTGAIQIQLSDFRQLSPDKRANDVALWYKAKADKAQATQALASLNFDGKPLEWRSSEQIRQISLKIFDRSFAVTYALEAAAILVALIGVAASFSAQALARQREFGVLHHVGVSPKTIQRQLLLEGGLLTFMGAIWGVALGFAMAWILIYRVNPQSFHWTMDVSIPWLAIGLGVIVLSVCAALCARLSAAQAGGQQALLSVRQDW
jgi:putative ABC transport system permease protein